MMLKYPSSLTALVLVLTLGCTEKKEAAPEAGSTAPANTATMPSLSGTPGELDTPAQQSSEQEASAQPPVPAVDFASADRPTNERGEALSDLDLLNKILTDFQEARATTSSGEIRAYKTEAEEVAAMEAKQNAAGPVKDLSELVRAGLIKAVPAAPPGKKFAIDPKTQKVVLMNL
ncbi:MAG: hypothetical protein AB1705_19330 [Verrucomicrobiota bacterium]